MDQISQNRAYLADKIDHNRDVLTLILGGPTKHYKYTKTNINKIFSKINYNLNKKNLQLIVIPSIRTPKEIIEIAKEFFGRNHLIINNVDKKAYLSSLSLSKFIVVTCDSSSMISIKTDFDRFY